MSISFQEIAKKCAKRIVDKEILIYLIGQGINIDAGVPEIRSKFKK